ncbi:MAG: hypothetical protein IT249_09395 [Chitinophagaceae bacterium]|nr:hypothetical protein [Chitinophagaceae bacterium]
MIRYLLNPRIFLMMVFSSLTIFSLAFSGGEGDLFRHQQTTADTIPSKKQRSRITLDNQSFQDNRVNMQAVEDAMREVERSMQKLKHELGRDYDNYIKDSYRKAMDIVNWQQIQEAKQRALAEAQRNLKEDIMDNRLALEQQLALADARNQLKLNRLNLERSQRSMQLAFLENMDRQMAKAKIQLKKAGKQSVEVNNLKTALENDGLIKNNGSYEIEIKDGDLYINGKKQNKKVTKKYRNKFPGYFEKGNKLKFKFTNDDQEKYQRIKMEVQQELI